MDDASRTGFGRSIELLHLDLDLDLDLRLCGFGDLLVRGEDGTLFFGWTGYSSWSFGFGRCYYLDGERRLDRDGGYSRCVDRFETLGGEALPEPRQGGRGGVSMWA